MKRFICIALLFFVSSLSFAKDTLQSACFSNDVLSIRLSADFDTVSLRIENNSTKIIKLSSNLINALIQEDLDDLALPNFYLKIIDNNSNLQVLPQNKKTWFSPLFYSSRAKVLKEKEEQHSLNILSNSHIEISMPFSKLIEFFGANIIHKNNALSYNIMYKDNILNLSTKETLSIELICTINKK